MHITRAQDLFACLIWVRSSFVEYLEPGDAAQMKAL